MNWIFTYNKKHQNIALHIAAWAIIFLLPVIFAPEVAETSPKSIHVSEFLYVNMITKIFWMLLFYFNITVLIPRLLYKEKYVAFIIVQLILFGVILVIRSVFYEMIVTVYPFIFYKSAIHNSPQFLFTVLGSIVYRTVVDRMKSERLVAETQRENLKTELAFLRSQVSPHFLFNVLNNIVSLVRMKSQELEPTILKLSSLLQYMLYETDEEKVLIKSEAEYLKSYIDLQKQRIGDRVTIDTTITLTEDWHTIEPMLLIPFVENSFKHGTGLIEDPLINILLKVDNNQLFFKVQNKYVEYDEVKDDDSGIGLANVQRRLELLYGKHHQLMIDQTNGWFTAELKIQF